jgi:serine protease inhibitor
VYIKAAVHKAYLNVNEKRTEAAGTTGITSNITSVPATPPLVYLFRAA